MSGKHGAKGGIKANQSDQGELGAAYLRKYGAFENKYSI
jgi:hypothetical protein